MDSSLIVKRSQLDFVEAWLRADGILVYSPRPDLQIDLETAQQITILGKELVDHPVPVLVHMGNVRRVTKEARALFASDEYTKVAGQSALLVTSPVSRVISNFFVGLDKPIYPVRVFTNENKALDWLKGFLQ
jgi:hypothetical protein